MTGHLSFFKALPHFSGYPAKWEYIHDGFTLFTANRHGRMQFTEVDRVFSSWRVKR